MPFVPQQGPREEQVRKEWVPTGIQRPTKIPTVSEVSAGSERALLNGRNQMAQGGLGYAFAIHRTIQSSSMVTLHYSNLFSDQSYDDYLWKAGDTEPNDDGNGQLRVMTAGPDPVPVSTCRKR